MSGFTVRARDRTYGVHFGDFRPHLQRRMEAGAAVVASRSAWDEHCEGLGEAGVILVDASEHLKSLDGVAELVGRLADAGVRKSDTVVALGGGTVMDAVAFTASILHRGVEWAYFPTSLVAQADACIGGKTAINVGERKNAVGNFHPPSAVYVDTAFLATLPEPAIRSGIGEILHFFIFADSPLLASVADGHEALCADPVSLALYVEESLAIKAAVVQRDEFDRGERNLLNYGHTFGHALESVTDYQVTHGEAVTLGMDIANRLSVEMGFLERQEYERLHAVLRHNFPREDVSGIDVAAYVGALQRDRKVRRPGHITAILCRRAGDLVMEDFPVNAWLRGFLDAYFRGLG